MLKVTVELLPFGGEEGKKTLLTFDIANDGTGTYERGNYKVRRSHNEEWIEGIVKDYPRTSYNVRVLLYRVLQGLKDLGKL